MKRFKVTKRCLLVHIRVVFLPLLLAVAVAVAAAAAAVAVAVAIAIVVVVVVGGGGGVVVVVVVVVGLLLFGVICYCCLLQLRAGRATQGAPRTSRRLREGPPTGETKTPESRNRGT